MATPEALDKPRRPLHRPTRTHVTAERLASLLDRISSPNDQCTSTSHVTVQLLVEILSTDAVPATPNQQRQRADRKHGQILYTAESNVGPVG